MRFCHTADWQIGMKLASVGEAARRVKEERLAACRRVIAAARDHDAEFCLVAGDTFEDNGVGRILVQQVADILSSFGGPVFILPGNHDPLAPGSVWEHPAWRACTRLRVIREERPIEIPGGALYPCPVLRKTSTKDPTSWIPAGTGAGLRVGVAHGTVEGVSQGEQDHPIAREAGERKGLDYLALGHWHSLATFLAHDGQVRMAYSGTPEPTQFGERDSGAALIVDISTSQGPVQLTPVRTGGLRWTDLRPEVRETRDLERILADIEAIADPQSTLVQMTLSGLLTPDGGRLLKRIEEILSSRFLLGRLVHSSLLPSPEDPSWVNRLPVGIVREAGFALQQKGGAGGADAEAAGRALLELYALVEEATP